MSNYTQFSQRLPKFLKASSDFEAGLSFIKRENNHYFPHIQCNPQSFQYRMVFDLDYHVSESDFDDLHQPSWLAFNPQNGHAHVAYELEIPIHRYDGAKHHPLEWGAKIQYAYTKKLKADPGYAEFLMKNPLHIRWEVHTFSKELVRLEDLAKFLTPKDLPKYVTKPVAETCHLGRNCHLFNTLRRWAYREVRQYWGGSRDSWTNACIAHATTLNNYQTPLPWSEVKSCGRSVAKWVWKKFNQSEFSKKQAKRSRVANQKRWAPSSVDRENKQVSARLMYLQGLTQTEIAEELGVSQQSISNWLKI